MNRKKITIFTLAMMNIATVSSIRSWPILAEPGLYSIFYLLLAVLAFFLPAALVSAELATGWPQQGGVFVWVREAFGHRWGFLAVWLLWLANLIWYPIILTFISATFLYILPIFQGWEENKIYFLFVSSAIFWILTWVNLKGIKISGKVSLIGVIVGNFFPALVIITLCGIWIYSSKELQVAFTWDTLIPKANLKQLPIFAGILLSLCGIELSAIHASDVDHPKKSYPKAILISTLIIIALSVLGILSVVTVIPHDQISLAAGSIQVLVTLVEMIHLSQWTPLMALLILLGALATLSAWIVGPSRGLLTVAEYGDLPRAFTKINRHGMPSFLLILQGIIVVLLNLIFIFVPTINSAYWVLTVMAAQIYLIMYILMFAAAIRLRYTHSQVARGYWIPGKKVGIWIVAGIGALSSLSVFIVSFFPTEQVEQLSFYLLLLILGMLLINISPFLLLRKKVGHSKK